MSINILQRIFVGVVRAQGEQLEDPWKEGEAIGLLEKDALKDERSAGTHRITTFFHTKRAKTADETNEDEYMLQDPFMVPPLGDDPRP